MTYFRDTPSPTLSELFDLRGSVALVAGGAGYLGSQASDALVELGCQVVVASRDVAACQTRCDELARRHPAAPRPVAAALDLTDDASVAAVVDEVAERFGRLDVLVNFAWSGEKNSFESIDLPAWQYDVEVSLTGTFRLVKASVPLLRQEGGVIVNVASMYGVVAPDPGIYSSERFTNPPSYGAAKAGVLQLTRYLATFLAADGIRVNAVSPGPFPFPETLQAAPEFEQRLGRKNPLGRVGRPHEVKAAIAYLCTDASSYVTGHNLQVDGGWTAW